MTKLWAESNNTQLLHQGEIFNVEAIDWFMY